MPGLFGTLHLGASSIQVQHQGIEVAGHNIANVSNPAYSRQRVQIATANAVPTPIGPIGTGAQVTGIQQLRSDLLDRRVTSESSVRGSLQAHQQALRFGQSILGQEIDRQATGPEGSAAAAGVGGQHALAERLGGLFNAFQSWSTAPASLADRQAVLIEAENVATEFNRVDRQLNDLETALNESIDGDVADANQLLTTIARLNEQIFKVEDRPGTANDLRDLRQQRIEELGQLVNITVSPGQSGMVDISLGGQSLVQGTQVLDTLETYDAGGGQHMVRTVTGAAPLVMTSGSIHGTLSARDGALQALRQDVNELASHLITTINSIHATGYSLTGSTGANLFAGTDASNIAVDSAVVGNAALLQGSGASGAVGDNQVALALAQVANQPQAALGNQTFSQRYSETVATFGQALSNVNAQLSDQEVVETMLLRQRDSLGGVSLDEEMTDMIKYQRAFEASARLITTVDELLQTIISM